MDNKARRLLFLDIFQELVDASAHQWEIILQKRCADDPEMEEALRTALAERVGAPSEDDLLHNDPSSTLNKGITSQRPADMTGQLLKGKYRIIKNLGKGGQGTVYLAQNEALENFVAIKVLTSRFSDLPQVRERFIREARLLAGLRHSNICSVLDADFTDAHLPFIVMEHLEGKTLAARLSHGPLPAEEVLSITAQIAEALQAAHNREIVHKDVKPHNVMLCDNGSVKLLDFGVAEDVMRRPFSSGGTSRYMSPEQARDEVVDYRTDIWSLGITMLEMLKGPQPIPSFNTHPSGSPDDLLEASDVEGLEEKSVLSPILKLCLKKDKTQRYPSMDVFLEDVQRAAGRLQKRKLYGKRIQALFKYTVMALILFIGAWLAIKYSNAGSKQTGMAVVFEPASGFDVDVTDSLNTEIFDATHLQKWLSNELNYIVPRMLALRFEEARYLRTSSPVNLSEIRDLEVYGLNVALDKERDSLFITLSLWHPDGHLQGAPERFSMGADYRTDKHLLEKAVKRLLLNQDDLALGSLKAAALEPIPRQIIDLDSLSRIAQSVNDDSEEYIKASYSPVDADSEWINQGFYHLAKGNYDAVIRIFTFYQSVFQSEDAPYAPGYLALAEAHWGKRDTVRADYYYNQVDALFPDDFVVLEWWAAHAFQIKEYDLADSLLMRALSIRPEAGEIYNSLGILHLAKKDTIAAATWYQQAINRGYGSYGYANLGYLYYAGKNYEKAALNYIKALALDSTHYRSWADLASTYARIAGKEAEAQVHFSRAVEIAEALLAENVNQPDLIMDLCEYFKELNNAEKVRAYLALFDGFTEGFEDFDYAMNMRAEVVSWLDAIPEETR